MNALEIESGEELERFDLGYVTIRRTAYRILTGYEGKEDVCWWCGKEINPNPRHAHYCRKNSHGDFLSCYRIYHRHFDWQSASWWAMERAGHKCENCGSRSKPMGRNGASSLRVHHIVPLKGSIRGFTAFNLPWNLIVLCHDCHMAVHAAMRSHKNYKTKFDVIILKEQGRLL